VAPVIGVLVIVATTVVASGVVALDALGPTAASDDVDGVPVGSAATARFTVDDIDDDGQRVTVLYRAGPPLDVASLELVVEAEGRTGRVVDLPAGRDERCFGDPDDVLGPENVANDTIFSRACGAASGAITAKGSDGVWEPGESASVTIKVADGGGADLAPGETVQVAIVDADREIVLGETSGRVR
jgi:FlaG/FlaF family flagellin (archaellin)